MFDDSAYQDAPSPPMTPKLRVACERAMHVILPDGKIISGGRASLFILERLGWGWFARLLSYPPFIWVVEAIYRLIANNRDFFARFLFRPNTGLQ